MILSIFFLFHFIIILTLVICCEFHNFMKYYPYLFYTADETQVLLYLVLRNDTQSSGGVSVVLNLHLLLMGLYSVSCFSEYIFI